MSRLGLFLSVAISRHRSAVLPAAAAAGTGSGGGDTARYILPPGNYGGLPTTDNSTDQLPLYDGLTPLRGQRHRRRHRRPLPARGLRSRSAPTHEEHDRPARPAAHLRRVRRPARLRQDPRRRRLRRRLGDGPRPRPAAPARPRPGPGAVADVPGIDAFSLVTSGQSFVPERRDRGARHRAAATCSSQTYGDEGPADHRRRPGRRRRHQRLLDGERHQPAAGDGERRHRRDRVHRLDLRRRRRRRGRQRRPARQARRTQLGPAQGHEAWDDAMLSDDPEAPTTHQAALRLRAAHRRQGHGLGRHRRRLGRVARPAAIGADASGADGPGDARAAAATPAAAAASRRRTSWSSRRSARPPATRWR